MNLFLPNNMIPDFPDDAVLRMGPSWFDPQIMIDYNNHLFVFDGNFMYFPLNQFPTKMEILSRDIKQIKDFNIEGKKTRFWLPKNVNRYSNTNNNDKQFYCRSECVFINNVLKDYYACGKCISVWGLDDGYITDTYNSDIIASHLLNPLKFGVYDFILRLASYGFKNIVYYDPLINLSSTITELMDICSYFNWEYEIYNEQFHMTNLYNEKFTNYLTWCKNNYSTYLLDLLHKDHSDCMQYDSLNQAFSSIIGV